MVRTVTYGLKALKYSGCILWNNLSTHIQTQHKCDSCGGDAAKKCAMKRCVNCCHEITCKKHHKKCYCGDSMSKNRCEANRCAKCCNNLVCRIHKVCSCGDLITPECIKKRCAKCCYDQYCPKHAKLCSCGKVATKGCQKKTSVKNAVMNNLVQSIQKSVNVALLLLKIV